MSLVKKSDVKNHLSPHHQKGIHLDPPLSQPDATGFSVEEPARTDSNVEEQRQQPSSSGLEAPPHVTSPDSVSTVAPTIPKSAQS
jgi:hypothetical protein